jgi:hypothetical protein
LEDGKNCSWHFAHAGFTRAYALRDGWAAWRAVGGAVEAKER